MKMILLLKDLLQLNKYDIINIIFIHYLNKAENF